KEAGAGRPLDREAVVREINSLSEKFIVIIGMAQLAGIAYALVAIQLRQRPRGLRRLGWQRLRVGHWLLVVGLMFPLAALCSQLQNDIFKLIRWSHAQMEHVRQP